VTYAQLIQAVYHEPALITPGAHASIRQLLESRLGQSALEPAAERKPGEGPCGEKVQVDQASVDDDGIAHIPVGGALGQGLKPFDRGEGAVDTLDLRAELSQFAADKKVRAAILDIDSPGGMVLGTPETAEAIARFRDSKGIYAFTRGMIASAAYWLAASTNGIYATPSSSVGSIGTLVTFFDLTKMADMKGIKVEVIKSGKFKGMGTPGTALNDEQRAHLQARVDQISAQFKAHVLANRDVPDDAMQGQMHLASDALKLGLIDGIVRDKAELRSQLLDSLPAPR
jgi:signal peptide peptidase SppA